MRPLRQAIRPNGARWILHLILTIVLMAGCAAGGGFGIYAAARMQDIGAGVVSLVILVGLEALIFSVEKKKISNLRWMYAKQQERFLALTADDLDRLDREAAASELRYKTFCLLQDYLYIPRAGLLLRYQEIAFWKTVRHSTNGMADAAWVEISEPDGMVWKVQVRLWKTYLSELDSFLAALHAHGFAQQHETPPQSTTSYR